MRSTETRGALVRLCAAGFVAYASYAICRSPLLPLFARELGAGPSLTGVIVGASTVTGVFLKLPAGVLSDQLGRRPLLLAGALVFAIMPITYLAVGSLALLVALRVVHGSATAIFGPVASATVSDLAPSDQRGAWMSLYATAQGTGQALGPVVAGYLIAAGRFDLAFMAAAVVGLATPIMVARWLPAAQSSRAPIRWVAFKAGLTEVAGHRLVLVTSAAHAAQFVINGALNAFLPLYGRDVVGLTAAQLGWLFGLQTLTTLAVRPLIGSLSDRAGRRGVIVAGLITCSVAVFAMAASDRGALIAAAIVVYATGVATTTAATRAYITDLTPRARYGAAHGVFGTIYDVGDALGPIGAGFVVAAFGYTTLFRVLTIIGVSMAVAFALATRGSGR
jgi:DHA1 family multidrug resistance protein-like MFS transporter